LVGVKGFEPSTPTSRRARWTSSLSTYGIALLFFRQFQKSRFDRGKQSMRQLGSSSSPIDW